MLAKAKANSKCNKCGEKTLVRRRRLRQGWRQGQRQGQGQVEGRRQQAARSSGQDGIVIPASPFDHRLSPAAHFAELTRAGLRDGRGRRTLLVPGQAFRAEQTIFNYNAFGRNAFLAEGARVRDMCGRRGEDRPKRCYA